MAPIEDYVHKPDNAASSLSEILEEYCLDPIFEVTPENLYDCVGILETLLAENPPLNPNPEMHVNFTQKSWSLLQRIEEFKDVREMFDLRP